MSADRLINIVVFYSEPGMAGTIYSGNIVEDRPQHEMLDQFEGWEPEVLQLLQVSHTYEFARSKALNSHRMTLSVLNSRRDGQSTI